MAGSYEGNESCRGKERMDEEAITFLVASGKVVIPCNKQHTSISPEGIGSVLN